MLMSPSEITVQIGGDPHGVMRVTSNPMTGMVGPGEERVLMRLRAITGKDR